MKKLHGIIAAMTTPFDTEGNVDVAILERMVDFEVEKGIKLVQMTKYYNHRPVRINIVEISQGANEDLIIEHPDDVVELALHAHLVGADGVGIVTPTYFTLDNRMLIEYYRKICQQLPKGFPVYVYVIPQLAHNDVDAATMQKIADACPDNVIGVKYSFADMHRMIEYCRVNDGKFSVVFGPDELFLPALSMGADGTVSGCAACIPEPYVEIYKCWKAGDLEGARRAQLVCYDLSRKLRYGADMSIFKNVYDDRGVGGGHMKAPLMDLQEEDVKKLLESVRPYYTK